MLEHSRHGKNCIPSVRSNDGLYGQSGTASIHVGSLRYNGMQLAGNYITHQEQHNVTVDQGKH